ncbi:hypothetical protein P280DRAFT_470359 [Massarina eburnea CBS 473.64]|uniref:Uncharacterized protein n=1 Tax=Massarina eburnea CBS 473.64 TaxID=1395130 RepID=A0A6A6RZW8_9PLEO|nr:hypothetical protein P280DRAFT_470359 [Massarina eburnea CBS 473.64]
MRKLTPQSGVRDPPTPVRSAYLDNKRGDLLRRIPHSATPPPRVLVRLSCRGI